MENGNYEYKYPPLDYEWLYDLPEGWANSFGEEMIDELKTLVEKYKFEKYQVVQVKEKFGELRWYDNGFPQEGYEEYSAWLSKYEDLSRETCQICGKKGKLYTSGWYEVLCDEHKGDRK